MILRLLPLAVLLCGCSQTEVSPAGFKTFNTNFATVDWTPTSFHATALNTSTPLNSNWRGINKLANTIESGVIGAAVPGTGAASTFTRAGAVIVPHVINPPTDAR